MPRVEQIWAPDGISYDWNSPEWIVIHYTATEASAYNNAVYFSRGGNWNSSAHYFVDGGGVIYQSVPEDRGAWHGGNYECNTHSIGIETVSAGEDFSAAEIAELSWLVGVLMDTYGIPASRVIRHYDVADYFGGYTVDPNKHCPASYVDEGKWQSLKAAIISGYDPDEEDEMSVWTYKNPEMNGNDDAYQILTDIRNAVKYGGISSWGYKNAEMNGEADTYQVLTDIKRVLDKLEAKL